MEDRRTKFMKIFANLPEKIRMEDIIVVIEEKPYTWNSAFFEIKNNSKIGQEILKRLESLGII